MIYAHGDQIRTRDFMTKIENQNMHQQKLYNQLFLL